MPEGSLTAEDVNSSLDKLQVPKRSRLAVAVSGGADSMCLAAVLNAVRPIVALIVDHGLRPSSAAEATLTAGRLTALGIDNEILVWQHEQIPGANIQASAREARYELMRDWCTEHEISFLCTAHHMDDQAETVLMRLARGSGVYGLAGMAGTRDLGQGVTLVRPLLDVSKRRLTATLADKNIEWVEDPSNQNKVFDRVKTRNLLADPPLAGLQAERLIATAQRLRRSRDALEFYQRQWLTEAVVFFEAGYALVDRNKFADVPEDIYLRALNSVIKFSGGGGYAPRFEKLLRLANALLSDEFSGHTLSGVKFAPFSAGKILVSREISAMEAPKRIQGNTRWDDRFVLGEVGSSPEHTLLIGPVGDAGRKLVLDDLSDLKDGTFTIPKQVLPTLPGLFVEEKLIAVPHLGYKVEEIELPVLSHQWLTLSEIGKKTYRGMQ